MPIVLKWRHNDYRLECQLFIHTHLNIHSSDFLPVMYLINEGVPLNFLRFGRLLGIVLQLTQIKVFITILYFFQNCKSYLEKSFFVSLILSLNFELSYLKFKNKVWNSKINLWYSKITVEYSKINFWNNKTKNNLLFESQTLNPSNREV